MKMTFGFCGSFELVLRVWGYGSDFDFSYHEGDYFIPFE